MSCLTRWAYTTTATSIAALGFYKNYPTLQKMAQSQNVEEFVDKYTPELFKHTKVNWDNTKPDSHFPFSISFSKEQPELIQENSNQNSNGPGL
jgi:hypothetical protein